MWLSSPRVHSFIDYDDALRVNQVPEPFPGAYDSSFLSMTSDEAKKGLHAGGFEDSEVRIERVELQWPSIRGKGRGVFGTPYGPLIAP